ncbi:hypothetical protein YOLOSWAG_158 [Erwinia phage vB_EamM_Yoloswag]|uniref:J domain-containing protein n=1 Tax=Erwinia phage vB_EamM_Yoloswag TaxID=1958956 RepID=A0A1S6L381_9CAUD|nr:hypothetical protein HOR66_gp158 [Erwinia phage vB_EamM_Yoloswag]AQT28638.1 hypothetical protein YOLOSWAG_158 [Erwinia phage vB_EamM_Yoloswag]
MLTQLMVPEGSRSVAVIEDEPQTEELDLDSETGQSELEELAEDIDRLETMLNFDTERLNDFMKRVDDDCREENVEVMSLLSQISALHKEMSESDDLEQQAAAERVKKALNDEYGEDEDDEASRSHMAHDDDEEMSEADRQAHNNYIETKRKCDQIYRKIVLKTHPDKCGNTSRLDVFREATTARMDMDLRKLERLYKRVYGHDYGKVSLIDQLIAARQRRDVLRAQIEQIRSMGAWQILQVSLMYDYTTALSTVRSNLHQQIHALREQLSTLERERNWM